MKNFCFFLFVPFVLITNQAFGAEVGMPQLNPEFWTAQIFWLIIVFTSLYLITTASFGLGRYSRSELLVKVNYAGFWEENFSG